MKAMKFIKRLVPILSLFCSTHVCCEPSPDVPVTNFHYGFETEAVDEFFGFVRVQSGTNGTSSSEGGWYAVGDGSEYQYTRFSGYSNVFQSYDVSFDLYLNDALCTGVNKRVDLVFGVSRPELLEDCPDGNCHRRDFDFNIGCDSTTKPAYTGAFAISASNNACGAWPNNPDRDPITGLKSGWYTFRSFFRDTEIFNDDGSFPLTVRMEVLDADTGNLKGSWTLVDPSDVIGEVVGGNRYGWLACSEFGEGAIPMDNINLQVYEEDACAKKSTKAPKARRRLVRNGKKSGQKFN